MSATAPKKHTKTQSTYVSEYDFETSYDIHWSLD